LTQLFPGLGASPQYDLASLSPAARPLRSDQRRSFGDALLARLVHNERCLMFGLGDGCCVFGGRLLKAFGRSPIRSA
jgi:hypothetical protein